MFPGTHARTSPDKPAVVMFGTGETLTYGELEERSVRLAHVLHDAGLRPGDSVALLSENSPRYHEAYWAALRSGLYLTAVNVHLSLEEQVYILRDCGARCRDRLGRARRRGGGSGARGPRAGARLAFGGPVAGYDDYETALAAASPEPFADQPAGADMLYSSGTTGLPEGDPGPAAGSADRRAGRPPRGRLRPDVRLRRGHRLPLPRAALPRRAAAVRAG